VKVLVVLSCCWSEEVVCAAIGLYRHNEVASINVFFCQAQPNRSSSWAELALFSLSPAYGLHNIAFGLHNIAYGLYNIAYGLHNIVYGLHNIAYGLHNIAHGLHNTGKVT
jgi:hypothetical protein